MVSNIKVKCLAGLCSRNRLIRSFFVRSNCRSDYHFASFIFENPLQCCVYWVQTFVILNTLLHIKLTCVQFYFNNDIKHSLLYLILHTKFLVIIPKHFDYLLWILIESFFFFFWPLQKMYENSRVESNIIGHFIWTKNVTYSTWEQCKLFNQYKP